MDSTFKFELRDAFILRVEPLKKIHRLLSDRIGPTAISAECADDVTRGFDGIAALEKYENSKAKRIVNLRLRAASDDWKKEATVEFIDRWYFGGTRIEIRARDDVVTRLRSDLLDVVAGLRPWYYLVNKIDVFLGAIIGLVAIIAGFLVLMATFGPTNDRPTVASSRQQAIGYLFGGVFGATYFGFAYLIHRFRRLLFPHGTFALGQEVARFETGEKWRWGVIIAILPSLAAGIALLWFSR